MGRDHGALMGENNSDWQQQVYKQAEPDSLNTGSAYWREIRRKILVRDKYTCQRCGKSSRNGKGLSIHHIVPRSNGGTDRKSNLLTLCDKCHDLVEGRVFTRAAIIGYEPPRNTSASPAETGIDFEISDSDERPDWHAWVYGGGKNPNK